MTPILTITLNPALDLATEASGIVPGPKLRCAPPQIDPGGGGINVSRAISHMGGGSCALVALGGATGTRLATALEEQDIPLHVLPAPGETRQSLAVTDPETGAQFRFVLPGPIWSESDTRAAVTACYEAIPPNALVVLSGSQPPGVPASFTIDLAEAIAPLSARLVVDTSGDALSYIVQHPTPGIAILRMDQAESESLAGRPLTTAKDSAAFSAGLVRAGAAQSVICARGAEGSVLATSEGQWLCHAAHVPVVSKVGAGDSFVAGLSLALARGVTLIEALQLGVAAASAAVMTPATELCRNEDVSALLSQCTVELLE